MKRATLNFLAVRRFVRYLAFGSTAIALVGHAAALDYRTIDGSNNNATRFSWGQAGTQELRMTAADYVDGIGTIRTDTNSNRPNARAISTAIFAQDASQQFLDENGLCEMAWAWGQFVDHDIDFSSGGSEVHMVSIPVHDADHANDSDGVIDVGRKQYVAGTGTAIGNPRQFANDITTWLDASLVYGSDSARASALRTRGGLGAKLRMHEFGDANSAADNLLPTAHDLVDAGIAIPSMAMEGSPTMGEEVRFIVGDVRANENTAILSLHTLMVREHNRRVDQLAATDPGLSDEDKYQIARKIVGAQMQAITYEEYLPAIGVNPDLSGGYDPAADPTIAVEFAHGIFRMAHTSINQAALRLNNDMTPHAKGPITLERSLFNPVEVFDTDGIEPFLLGLISNMQEATNEKMVPGLRNGLFQIGPTGVINDLAAIDIERGRDIGLGDYNQVRVALGLDPVGDFADITSDPDLQTALSGLYHDDVNDLDLWVAMLAEDHVPGVSSGPTVQKGLENQFTRLAIGDRFFYRWDEDLATIESTYGMTVANRLADLILANTDIPASSIRDADNVMFVQFIPEPSSITLLGIAAVIGLIASRRHA